LRKDSSKFVINNLINKIIKDFEYINIGFIVTLEELLDCYIRGLGPLWKSEVEGIPSLVLLADNEETFITNIGLLHEEMLFLTKDLIVFKADFWVEDLDEDRNTNKISLDLLRFLRVS